MWEGGSTGVHLGLFLKILCDIFSISTMDSSRTFLLWTAISLFRKWVLPEVEEKDILNAFSVIHRIFCQGWFANMKNVFIILPFIEMLGLVSLPYSKRSSKA